MKFQNQSKQDLFANLDRDKRQVAERLAESFLEKYHLSDFYQASQTDNYRENLYYLEILERALVVITTCLPDEINIADIGASDWFYVQALYALLKWGRCQTSEGRQIHLSGFEVDPYRVYTSFHSRYDHAIAHIRGLSGVTYIPRPFIPQHAAYDLITMLFPFIFLSDHLSWGLPRDQFAPRELLTQVWLSLKLNGVLVIINQGEEEHQAQCRMLTEAGITIADSFKHDSILYQYQHSRYVVVVQNNEQR